MERAATDPRLSLAFMRAHPAPAARVLEALPVEAAATLFDRVPARLGSTVLAAMLPRAAARCIGVLDDARALDLLAAMGTQPMVAVLRYLGAERRRALVAALPTAAALASAMLLGHAEDSLGAWADPDVIVLPPDARAGDALQRLRAQPGEPQQVWVGDAQRKLAGSVSLQALLRAPEAATLSSLLQCPAALLPAHAPLAGSLAHPGWQLASLLPVVEPGDKLVGTLSHDALMRAVQRHAPDTAAADTQGLPAIFAQAYWQALSGLVEAGLALLPRVTPVLRDAADER